MDGTVGDEGEGQVQFCSRLCSESAYYVAMPSCLSYFLVTTTTSNINSTQRVECIVLMDFDTQVFGGAESAL